MKNLLVMRHAKSDWEHNLPDIERPLNKRGKKAAPIMGEELLKRNKIPDVILCSPAKRARSTAKRIIETLEFKNGLTIVKDFYFGSNILEILKAVDNDHQTIMVVGHNPTWEDIVMELIVDNRYITMPTAAIASITFDIDDWSNLKQKSGSLEWLIAPKTI